MEKRNFFPRKESQPIKTAEQKLSSNLEGKILDSGLESKIEKNTDDNKIKVKFDEFCEKVKSLGARMISYPEFKKDLRFANVESHRKRNDHEVGFIYEAHGLKAWCWTSFILEKGELRPASSDAGWVLITKRQNDGNRAVYFSDPIKRRFTKNYDFFYFLFLYFKSTIEHLTNRPFFNKTFSNGITISGWYNIYQHDKYPKKKIVKIKNEEREIEYYSRKTYWKFQYVDPIDNVDIVKTLSWDYNAPSFSKDVIDFLKEKRRKTSEYNKKRISSGKPNKGVAREKRKPWRSKIE